MTPEKAKRVVVVSTGGMVLITTISSVGTTGDLPTSTVLIGGFVVAIALAVGAEFAPPVAAGLAGVGLITALFVYGAPAAQTIVRLTQQGAPK